ncbi:MAG: hypothetical protein WCF95_01250 [bacterium]
MVGINPSIKYQKINFGAYDTADNTALTAVPGEISNDPYTDRHGTKLKDHRNLLQLTNLKKEKTSLNPEYDYYMNQNSQAQPQQRKRSIIKPLLTLGVVVAGGILAYKKRKPIADFFKKIFNKNAVITEPPRTGLKTPPKRISAASFTTYYQDAITKADNGTLDTLKLDNMQVIMRNNNAAEKTTHLQNLYDLGELYAHKDYQARISLIMPESMANDAEHVVDMFAKNRIDEVDDELIRQIEGFKILNIKRELADKHDMIVESQVRYGVNAKNSIDVASKWGRNVRDFLRDFI